MDETNDQKWDRRIKLIQKNEEDFRKLREEAKKKYNFTSKETAERVAAEDARAIAEVTATANFKANIYKMRNQARSIRFQHCPTYTTPSGEVIGGSFPYVLDHGPNNVIFICEGRYAEITATCDHFSVRCQGSTFMANSDGSLEDAFRIIEEYILKGKAKGSFCITPIPMSQ